MAYKKQAFHVYERLNYVLKPNKEKKWRSSHGMHKITAFP